MSIHSVNTSKENELSKSDECQLQGEFSKAAQLEILLDLLEVVQNYLDAVEKNIQKVAEQDKAHQSALLIQKSRKKDHDQAVMEENRATNNGRMSGNSFISKKTNVNSSYLSLDGNKGYSTGIGLAPSYT